MYDIFISYRRKQGFAVAKVFSGLLQTKGISAFVDLEELRSGTFDDKILTAIQTSPAFLLILTPGALDRCDEEGDWLTREISAAIDSGRNIIPVLCDGFEWPKHWEPNVPDGIKLLSKYNSVIMSYEYINATVDKVIEYMQSDMADSVKEPVTIKPNESAMDNDIESFFNIHMTDIDAITGLDFAFHAGSAWHQDIDRLDILSTLADAGIQIRVIVNTPEVAATMGKYMRHKLKNYLPFEEAIALWKKLASMYENVSVRVTDIPLLRIYYSFTKKDSSQNASRVKFYTHGNPNINRNYIQNFSASDPFYKLYQSEFEFLWKNAKEGSDAD